MHSRKVYRKAISHQQILLFYYYKKQDKECKQTKRIGRQPGHYARTQKSTKEKYFKRIDRIIINYAFNKPNKYKMEYVSRSKYGNNLIF